MQSIWCESRPHSGLWEDSSFPIHSQQQWDKTKIDKAEAAAGARVLWLTSSEQSNTVPANKSTLPFPTGLGKGEQQ